MDLFLPSILVACWNGVFDKPWPGLTRCWDMTIKGISESVRVLCYKDRRRQAPYPHSRLAKAPGPHEGRTGFNSMGASHQGFVRKVLKVLRETAGRSGQADGGSVYSLRAKPAIRRVRQLIRYQFILHPQEMAGSNQLWKLCCGGLNAGCALSSLVTLGKYGTFLCSTFFCKMQFAVMCFPPGVL